MKLRRIISSVLCSALLLTGFTQQTVMAGTIDGEGTISSLTDFDTSDMYDGKIIVMIPDKVDLALNNNNDKFVGSGFVTAWGKTSPRTTLSIATDKEITYENTKNSDITVDASVVFANEETNIGTWSGTTLGNNINATSKVGYDVNVSANKSSLSAIGKYVSTILFNISVANAQPFTYYLAFDYVNACSYTANNSSIDITFLPSGETAAELTEIGTDKDALEAAHDNVIASTAKNLVIPSKVNNLPVIGVSLDSFLQNSDITDYVNTITIPSSVEGLELATATDCEAATDITVYNVRSAVNVSKNKPDNAVLRFFPVREMFTYESTTVDGVEGYCANGLTEYAKSTMINCDEDEFTLTVPDTYNDKPVLDIRFMNVGGGAGTSLVDFCREDENFKDKDIGIILKCGSNMKKLRGYSRSSLKIKKVIINDGLKYIGDDAFTNVTALEEVNIPASVESIGESAFGGCTNLTSVTFADGFNGAIKYDAFSGTGLATINMPSSFTNINYSGLQVPMVVIDNNAEDITVWNGGAWYKSTIYRFNDADYVCEISNENRTSTPLNLDADGNILVNSEAALLNLRLGLTGNEANGNVRSYTKDFDKKIIIGEGITNLSLDIKNANVQLPSTMNNAELSNGNPAALTNCTLSGNTDFRNYTTFPYLDDHTKAENLILRSSQLGLDRLFSNYWDCYPQIKNLYITYDSTPGGDSNYHCHDIENIYFSGTEAEWAEVKAAKFNDDSINDVTVHCNESF